MGWVIHGFPLWVLHEFSGKLLWVIRAFHFGFSSSKKKNSGNLLWVIPGLSFGNDNLWFDSGVGFCLSFEFVR